jgi:hypothetical protein
MQLLLVLVGCMAVVALVINPLLVLQIRRNPYPLVCPVPARKRRDRLLYPQLGGKHSGQHVAV